VKEALLVAWCIDTEGRKHLLHLAVGNKESEACWSEYMGHMVNRGLAVPHHGHDRRRPGCDPGRLGGLPCLRGYPLWFPRLANIKSQASR